MRAIGLNENDSLIEAPFPEHYSFIAEFPSEFKRKWLKQLDPRFMAILLVTFVFEVGGLLLLLAGVANQATDSNGSAMHAYAKMLLTKFDGGNADIFEKNRETYLFGVTEYVDQSTADAKNQTGTTKDRLLETNYSGSRGTDNSQDSFQSARSAISSDAQGGASGANHPANQVAQQGLLSYIAADGERVSNEEIREIFSFSDRYSRNLEGSLSHVKLANITKVEGTASASTSARASSMRKGAQATVSAEDLQASFTPISQATMSTIARNTELENFSISALAERGKKTTTRQAENVAQIIHSHNRAIQDCYKQALKSEPDIQGKIVVRIIIAPSGGVESVQVLQSTIQYEPMILCLVNRMKRWNDFGESDASLGSIGYRQTYVFGY